MQKGSQSWVVSQAYCSNPWSSGLLPQEAPIMHMIAEKCKPLFSFLFQSMEATTAAVPVLHIVQCHIMYIMIRDVCDTHVL